MSNVQIYDKRKDLLSVNSRKIFQTPKTIDHDEYLHVNKIDHFRPKSSSKNNENDCKDCQLCKMKRSKSGLQEELQVIEKIMSSKLQQKLNRSLPVSYNDKPLFLNLKISDKDRQYLNSSSRPSYLNDSIYNLNKKRLIMNAKSLEDLIGIAGKLEKQTTVVNLYGLPSPAQMFKSKPYIHKVTTPYNYEESNSVATSSKHSIEHSNSVLAIHQRYVKAPLRSLLDGGNQNIYKHDAFKACLISEDYTNRLSKLNLGSCVKQNTTLKPYRIRSSNYSPALTNNKPVDIKRAKSCK